MEDPGTPRSTPALADGQEPQTLSIAGALAEFGSSHQIEQAEHCIVAIKRPSPSAQEITTGRTVTELLAKLRAERDGQGRHGH